MIYRVMFIAAAVWLCGCTPPETGPALLDDYFTRIGRSLDINVTRVESEPQLSIVNSALSPLPLPASQIGVLEFLSLSDCALQQNLGRRNSHLGRHASHSQRLLLDLEFLRLAPACIERLQDDKPALADQLRQFFAERQAALPISIYNALLAGIEWQRFWRLPNSLGDYPQQIDTSMAVTLDRLSELVQQWLHGDWRADPLELEQLLGRLRAGDGGSLLRAAGIQHAALSSATGALQQKIELASLCPFDSDTAASRALRNVATRHFAKGVQPWLADLRRREAQLMPSVRRIEAVLDAVLPVEYQHWRDRREHTLSTLIHTPRRHALAINDALADCGGIQGQP